MMTHIGALRPYLSSALLVLLCGWLVFGGPAPDPFELGLAKCLDEDLDDVDADDLACLIGIGFATGGGNLARKQAAAEDGSPAIGFEANVGQVAAAYGFAARGKNFTAFLDAGGVAFDVRDRLDPAPTVVRARIVDGSSAAAPEGLDAQPGRVNYFYGNDPDKWVTDIPVFNRVRYKGVYRGVDVEYYGKDGWIEHDFIVHPGSDPARIQVALEGADQTWVDAQGDLRVRAGARELTWKKPVLYQNGVRGRRAVEGRYRLLGGNRFGFETGVYDATRPLVIDPVVAFSTMFGGSASDGAGRVAVDANGNAYIAGMTVDTGFPITPGAYSTPGGGARAGDLFVAKLNSTGSQMVYTTRIGGAFLEGSVGVALDSAGNAYVAGSSKSQDYPTTEGAPQRSLQGTRGQGNGMDCVVTKINSAGNALVYSTYLGGNATDACLGIAVDTAGSAYLAGWTRSTNFPTSGNAPQATNRGRSDVFIAKLNPAGTALVWSTLLGGTKSEEPTGIAVDAQGAAYVTGHTSSNLGFPVTASAYQRTYGGSAAQPILPFGDAFVAKLNPDGGAFAYVTYLGGNRDDVAGAIAVDAQGNAYVVGSTLSTNFPVTAQAVGPTFRGGVQNTIFPGGDGFVTKLNATGSALVYSTYLGGSQDDWASAVTVDAGGNAWVTGATLSSNFPVSQDATQRTYGGTDPEANFATGDAFVAQVNPGGTALVFSTFLGGVSDDLAMGVAQDRGGSVYVAGSTRSRNFPTTAGVVQAQYGGANTVVIPLGDAFLTKFNDTGGGGGGGGPVSIAGVASAASYAGGGVAPGEMIVFTGTNIGPNTLTMFTLNAARNTVNNLVAGTRVLFDDVAAPLIYVSAGQSSAMVPYSVAGRANTQMVVEYNGVRSAPVTLPVLSAKPALFAANSSGRGPGAILNEDYSLNTAGTPAGKGRIILLYGTGEGQTRPAGIDGRLALTQLPVPVLPVSVTIGGIAADVLYAGTAPQNVAGFFQMNVKVPENAPSGALEVIVTVGGVRSQTGLTVAVR
ncbi:MAG: SBBP repeat-containing protein [Bryobacterales bacterium]|nr:SBBP repeat-containing protein [Bryobacterales bacterium]